MINRLVSSKGVISKVFRDLDFQEESHRVSDFQEWIGEALEKIGAFYAFNIKITGKEGLPLLIVSDYQAKLPADLINILGVQYASSEGGAFIPLRYGTSTFGARGLTTTSSTLTATTPSSDIITTVMNIFQYTYEEALAAINDDPLLRANVSTLLAGLDETFTSNNYNVADEPSTMDYVYYLNNNYIKLNVRSGFLKLAYQAMPLDEEGYPMVPDHPSFFEALYWYIVVKYLYPKWLGGHIRDGIYMDARSNWNFYCKQAYGTAMMPNVDKLESLKNKWLQLYPEINEHDSLFSSSGNKQILYNH